MMQPLPRCGALLRHTSSRRIAWAATATRYISQSQVRKAQSEQPPPPTGPHDPFQAAFQQSPPPRRGGLGIMLKFAAIFSAGAGAYYYFSPLALEPESEPSKKASKPKKTKKTIAPPSGTQAITSQHEQLETSWNNPGVYLWGSNAGKVIAPDSNETVFKSPRRIPFFNGEVLRDLKIRHDFGAAITENGNLVIWGGGLSPQDPEPVEVLPNKNLVKLAASADRVIALSSDGTVYSVPVNRKDQLSGEKLTPNTGSWMPFWNSTPTPDAINYRILTPKLLRSREYVVDVSSGLEHCLMLTSSGRVFSTAASTLEFPSRGQLGVPGLTWETRPDGPYDQAHEVKLPTKNPIVQIAAGDYHSAMLDKAGKIFVCGDNALGQLGYVQGGKSRSMDKPIEIDVKRLYEGTEYEPKVTSLTAGGSATFFTVDGFKIKNKKAAKTETPEKTADVWACGSGVVGTLGNGKFVHSSQSPVKVNGLSSLFEFDEKSGKLAPIKISQLSIGSDHACAVMANKTKTSSSATGTDTNFGSDVLVWGGNGYFQLGTGKRKNVNSPVFISGLDPKAEGSRLQVAPRKTVTLEQEGKRRRVNMEQRVECGQLVTAVYSAL